MHADPTVTPPGYVDPDAPAPGSTLHLDVPPTLAFSLGGQYAAVVARIGRKAVNAGTLALIGDDHAGLAVATVGAATRLADQHRGPAAGWYHAHDQEPPADSPWRIVVRSSVLPAQWTAEWRATKRPGRTGRVSGDQSRRAALAHGQYVAVAALLRTSGLPMTTVPGRIPNTAGRLVQLGELHQRGNGGSGETEHYYPLELRRSGFRTGAWLPNQHPKRDSEHEWTAYAAAGFAQVASIAAAAAQEGR